MWNWYWREPLPPCIASPNTLPITQNYYEIQCFFYWWEKLVEYWKIRVKISFHKIVNNNNMETPETILRGLAASICTQDHLLAGWWVWGRWWLKDRNTKIDMKLWSSPNSSHLNRLLSLQHKFCLSSLGNGQQSEEAGQCSSCYFAHQNGGSCPSSSLNFVAMRI